MKSRTRPSNRKRRRSRRKKIRNSNIRLLKTSRQYETRTSARPACSRLCSTWPGSSSNDGEYGGGASGAGEEGHMDHVAQRQGRCRADCNLLVRADPQMRAVAQDRLERTACGSCGHTPHYLLRCLSRGIIVIMVNTRNWSSAVTGLIVCLFS
ncbi:hypothetical protein PENTCL1PPCAC_23916 [Pristionchus entomophagus]|uniref:Uncharacterized protein n=1 Tax=Pristionchus entomophagus TaxID=358040 RepID=A0AAV5U5E6_9BILA|nr:hypothetical protein PENTCL1PPCAC_23916 [Pristionchus entomophagus]